MWKREIAVSIAAGFAGAIIGGMITGWLIGFSGYRSLISSLLIGLLSGSLPGLFAAGMIGVPIGAAFGGAGYLWGQFLDVNFHFKRETIRWLMKSHPGLSLEAATSIAEVQRQGATPWILFRERIDVADAWWIILSAAVAALAAFLTINLIRRGEDAGQI